MDVAPAQTLNWLQWLGVALTPVAWATHVAIALAMQALIALPLRRAKAVNAWWIAAAAASAYAYSREKTEFEFHLRAVNHGQSLGPYWYRGFIPLEWSASSQAEFIAPTIAVFLVAWMASRRARGR